MYRASFKILPSEIDGVTALQMREIAEIELAIQGGTEKIEALGMSLVTLLIFVDVELAQASKGRWRSL